MNLSLWQVDAFASKALGGNPAAVIPLDEWLPDALMQAIAGENNLSETAFFVRIAPGLYDLRWFTPNVEIELCGHATLASAWVVFDALEPQLNEVRFQTKSGVLVVERGEGGVNRLSLPADSVKPFAAREGFADELAKHLGVAAPASLESGRYLMGVWNEEASIRAITLGGGLEAFLGAQGFWGFIATAPGNEKLGDGKTFDFVSRFFAPAKGVPEDPVTGSAHCALVPYWAKRLGRKDLRAFQASARGGELRCRDEGARVSFAGPCALYLRGTITI